MKTKQIDCYLLLQLILVLVLQVRMRFELKSPVKTIEDFIKRFTPSRLTSGSNNSSSSSLITNRSSNKGCSSLLSSPSAESTLTKLNEEHSRGGLDHTFSPAPPSYDGKVLGLEEGELRYEAESPDEAALVYAARAYKCSLVGRLPDQVTVELPHLGKLSFELLHTLGFDSTRKRMSVVVRHPLTDQITVYTKGADSVIMDLIKPPSTGRKSIVAILTLVHTIPVMWLIPVLIIVGILCVHTFYITYIFYIFLMYFLESFIAFNG